MKKKMFIIGIIVLLICVCFSGCNENENNTIEVIEPPVIDFNSIDFIIENLVIAPENPTTLDNINFNIFLQYFAPIKLVIPS